MDCKNQARRLLRMRTDIGGFHADRCEFELSAKIRMWISDYARCPSHGLIQTTPGTPQR